MAMCMRLVHDKPPAVMSQDPGAIQLQSHAIRSKSVMGAPAGPLNPYSSVDPQISGEALF
jgi:hypothetical protein